MHFNQTWQGSFLSERRFKLIKIGDLDLDFVCVCTDLFIYDPYLPERKTIKFVGIVMILLNENMILCFIFSHVNDALRDTRVLLHSNSVIWAGPLCVQLYRRKRWPGQFYAWNHIFRTIFLIFSNYCWFLCSWSNVFNKKTIWCLTDSELFGYLCFNIPLCLYLHLFHGFYFLFPYSYYIW